MKGQQGAFRLRIGDIRVLFTLDYTALVMDVVKIAHRREAYR
jgi:mRNA-degrading endonuclease RelE of RelBE toxin-antitoxin system